jgi:hypothetical protein
MEDAMNMRALLCGICLIAANASSGIAQTPASPADNPVTNKPTAVDATTKTPTKIPEIIRQPDGSDNITKPRAIVNPGSVLKPPTVNLQFLRAIRLDWDQIGKGNPVAVR